MHDVALKAADRAVDITQIRSGSGSVKQLLHHWLQDAGGFRKQHGSHMMQECERLLQGYKQKQVRKSWKDFQRSSVKFGLCCLVHG